jgi:hypothetical protein
MTEPIEPAPVWKRGLAATLDLITAFLGFGWLIAYFTGNTSGRYFHLDYSLSLLWLVVTVAYFFIGRRYVGGTLWDRILRIGRPQPYK